jgi:hypothetical protein
MSTKSHTHKKCRTLRRKLFSTKGYAEIHIQRLFFDNKKGIQTTIEFKIQMVSTCFTASSSVFYLGNLSLKSDKK